MDGSCNSACLAWIQGLQIACRPHAKFRKADRHDYVFLNGGLPSYISLFDDRKNGYFYIPAVRWSVESRTSKLELSRNIQVGILLPLPLVSVISRTNTPQSSHQNVPKNTSRRM